MNTVPLEFWIMFNALVLCLLALDLFVFHRKAHAISAREAAFTSAVWISLSCLFGMWVWKYRGSASGLEFFTGYLIEYSLSVDNIFIFVLIFSYFRVPPETQHRVLFWGVLGALVMRGTMIAIGSALISRFHWVLYLFGAFLVFTGIKMLVHREDDEMDLEKNPLLSYARRHLPLSGAYEGSRFMVRHEGRRLFTPLMLVLIMVESTDLIFAVDSIPAIFAVTQDPFIVYTSNVCAILGLRSLYFLLARVVHKFVYLKIGLSIVLTFIGCKMLLADVYKISTPFSLLVVGAVLAVSVGVSLIKNRAQGPPGR
jgi:tellurite resistance protein TerC